MPRSTGGDWRAMGSAFSGLKSRAQPDISPQITGVVNTGIRWGTPISSHGIDYKVKHAFNGNVVPNKLLLIKRHNSAVAPFINND